MMQPLFSLGLDRKTPLIIDTDMATDDIIAISYLLRDNSFDIKAIILDNNASTNCQYSYPHLKAIITLTGHNPIPIGCGLNQAWGDGHRFPKWLQSKFNLMPGVSFPKLSLEPLENNGVPLLINILSHTDQPITILEIGSLTNLATALKEKPNLKEKISKIYMMGGAINVPGNIQQVNPKSHNKTAEWNIYFDPVAANFIFQLNLPFYLTPLDATNHVPISLSFYQDFFKTNKSALGQLIYELLKINLTYIQKHLFYFWDPLAAVSINNSICSFEPMNLKVILKPENEVGAIIVTPNGNQIFVCTKPNTELFMQILKKAIQ